MDVITNPPGNMKIRPQYCLNNIKIHLLIHSFFYSFINVFYLFPDVWHHLPSFWCFKNMKETVLILKEFPLHNRKYSRRKTMTKVRSKIFDGSVPKIPQVHKREASDPDTEPQ